MMPSKVVFFFDQGRFHARYTPVMDKSCRRTKFENIKHVATKKTAGQIKMGEHKWKMAQRDIKMYKLMSKMTQVT